MTFENSQTTPCKATSGHGCFVCSTEVQNAKYRTKIVGRTHELLENVCNILGVAKEQVCNQYLCRSCLRQVNKCAKFQKEIENCKINLVKVYWSENERYKRCLPTDVETSPNVAPLKKLVKQSTNAPPKRRQLFSRNELPNDQTSYEETHCNIATNPSDNIQRSSVQNQRASETVSNAVSFSRNDLSEAICQVQVKKY